MNFSSFIDQAWDDHAGDARAVAQRLPDGIALVADEAQLAALANLAHHVHGEHLGEWRAGIDFMQRLCGLAPFTAQGESGSTLRRCVASLTLSEGSAAGLDALSVSDRIRVGAMASANLAERDTTRAMHLFDDALDRARRCGPDLPITVNRALAATGNGLACTLEQKAARSADERALMILAAQTARHHWERAGTWLEVERAEYRLAMTWLQAGDLARGRTHAHTCLEIVASNDAAALERFFGWEALGRVERAAGNAAGHARALTQAREAFAELDDSEQGGCLASLDKLALSASPRAG
jgi:hypothetical protein